MAENKEIKPAKSWCFTINNPTEADAKILKDWEKTYLVFGEEVGESGTPHFQGFITFKRAYRLTQLKKLHKTAHWEPAITGDAMNYCMKDGNYYIEDNRKKKGERTDLKQILSKSFDQIVSEHPDYYVKYHNGIEKLFARSTLKRDFKPVVTWIHGPSGVGKTRQVVESEPDLWISGKNLKWWNGYENQEAVLFDDFRADFCTFHELLRILDRYPYTPETKGGYKQFNSKRIYITSCYHPSLVYNTREDIQQLMRRIDNIVTVT